MGIRDAEAKVQRGVNDDLTGLGVRNPLPDGLNRWRDALRIIELVHGKKALDEVEAEILG